MTMTKSTANIWHEKYQQDEYLYGTDANDFLRAHSAHIPAGGRVLSIGEGEGRNAVYLAQQGYEVTAIDAAESGLEKVAKLAQARGVKVDTQLIDLNDYEFAQNHWDGIINVFCHLPPTLRQQVHGQIITALKPNGVFLLEAYSPRQLEFNTGGPSTLELLYCKNEIKNEMAELTIEYLQEVERYIKEGKGHDGMSAVVQLLARKS